MSQIVAVTAFHDYIVIFCSNGAVYRMVIEDLNRFSCTFYRIAEFHPEP